MAVKSIQIVVFVLALYISDDTDNKDDNDDADLCFLRKSECMMLLLVGCLTSQQHASVSRGRIFSDNFNCCHTEIEVTDQTFYLTQSQYTDTGPTSPSADHFNARRLAG